MGNADVLREEEGCPVQHLTALVENAGEGLEHVGYVGGDVEP
ncbi:hypothetical protein [Streptomyces sp. NPDC048516]